MAPIRVLIVDDAVVVRRLISDALSSDADIEVVGTAQNGRVGLEKIRELKPDAVVLDIEMPEMDGLAALAELRKTHPRLPVVMFSTVTERGAKATLDALALGANDYVTKPSNVGSAVAAIEAVKRELIPKIKAFCHRLPLAAAKVSSLPAPAPAAKPAVGGIEIVAVGVSTGGPNVLAALLPTLIPKLPVPVVIVQHMPPVFTRLLAERLAAKGPLPVREGAAGEVLRPGTVWIAPGDYHMVVARQASGVVLATNQDPPENSCRPAVDVLFRSVAQVYGARALAVVLTGMGHDGLRGCQAVRAAGGQILVQDRASSVVWSMPGAVAEAKLADQVLPLNELAAEINRRAQPARGGVAPARIAGATA